MIKESEKEEMLHLDSPLTALLHFAPVYFGPRNLSTARKKSDQTTSKNVLVTK